MQDAYVRAYASLDQFSGKAAKFSTWLAKIAVYEALSRLRKRRRIQDLSLSPDQEDQRMEMVKSSGPDPGQQALRGEAASLLEQTAACLDVTQETVKVRLLRVRQMLRQELYTRVGTTSSQAFQFMGERCDRVVQRVFAKLFL